MRFRFNVLLNGFVIVSVAVQSATVEALAHAEILDGRGTKMGDADITSTDQGFTIAVKPSSCERGTHIHPVGKRKAPEFISADNHFDPTFARHGAQNTGDAHPHLEDLPNLVVGNNGSGMLTLVADGVSIKDEANSIFHEITPC